MTKETIKIVELCRQLSDSDFQEVFQEMVLLQTGISSNESASLQDAVPIDVPIHHSINTATGDLYIEYPFSIGILRNIGWKTVRVTPAAQVRLAHILYEALSAGEESGSNQATPTKLQ